VFIFNKCATLLHLNTEYFLKAVKC